VNIVYIWLREVVELKIFEFVVAILRNLFVASVSSSLSIMQISVTWQTSERQTNPCNRCTDTIFPSKWDPKHFRVNTSQCSPPIYSACCRSFSSSRPAVLHFWRYSHVQDICRKRELCKSDSIHATESIVRKSWLLSCLYSWWYACRHLIIIQFNSIQVNSIKFFIIYVPSQQLQGQLQTQHSAISYR
jgi:hypothetical protein